MPGAKRKIDEDTWILSQSKKFKAGTLLANVYASTLAQLRMGARRIFNSGEEGGRSIEASGRGSGSGSPGSTSSVNQSAAGSSSPFHSPPASPVMRDLLSDEDGLHQPEVDLCLNCAYSSRMDGGGEKCYYCDKVVCHLQPCEGCGKGYCNNCCITRYDAPSGETYLCYGCPH